MNRVTHKGETWNSVSSNAWGKQCSFIDTDISWMSKTFKWNTYEIVTGGVNMKHSASLLAPTCKCVDLYLK
jgi:hypothetical protein